MDSTKIWISWKTQSLGFFKKFNNVKAGLVHGNIVKNILIAQLLIAVRTNVTYSLFVLYYKSCSISQQNLVTVLKNFVTFRPHLVIHSIYNVIAAAV